MQSREEEKKTRANEKTRKNNIENIKINIRVCACMHACDDVHGNDEFVEMEYDACSEWKG